jgi:CRP-like cAMP-binding protein
MNEADYLATVSLFSYLKKKDLRRIAKLSRQQVFQKGDVIIREGDRDGRLFVVLTGEVEIVKNLVSDKARALATLGPNSYFGEMAMIDNYVRSASVVAKKETTVLYIDQWDLRQPICRCCKRVRTKNGSWLPMEEYVKDDSDTESNHSICPECEKG